MKGEKVSGVPPSPFRLPASLKLRQDKTEGRQVSGVRKQMIEALEFGPVVVR